MTTSRSDARRAAEALAEGFLAPIPRSLPTTVPFVGPEAQERARGRLFRARLGANESLFGPSPHALDAMAEAATESWMYGDPEAHDLRRALADRHDVAPQSVMIGEGIDGLLGLLCRLTLAPGAVAVTGLGSYPTFAYHVAGCGGRLRAIPYREADGAMAPDIDAMAEAARADGARLLYLANPDNPTGALHGPEAIRSLLAKLPADCLLALDEAYIDCAPPGAALPLDCSRPGVLRLRTFSKAYGLAGIRVGYAIGHPTLIGAFDRIRNHFGLGRVAQAGALAALEDTGHHDGAVAWIAAARDRIAAIARKAGLKPLPSAGNFVAMDCAPAGVSAAALLAALDARDVFVRRGMTAPLDRLLRVSCGHRDDLDLFEAALPGALAELRGA